MVRWLKLVEKVKMVGETLTTLSLQISTAASVISTE